MFESTNHTCIISLFVSYDLIVVVLADSIWFKMWVKQCHKPAMTGNGNHFTYKHGDDYGMVYGIVLPHCLLKETPRTWVIFAPCRASKSQRCLPPRQCTGRGNSTALEITWQILNRGPGHLTSTFLWKWWFFVTNKIVRGKTQVWCFF